MKNRDHDAPQRWLSSEDSKGLTETIKARNKEAKPVSKKQIYKKKSQ
jgi:hypothetical protein